MVVARDDGTRAVRRFTVRVRPHAPIPDAGRPRRVAAGDRVRLGSPGGAAVPSGRGTVLEHSWTIVSAPRRSKVRLRHPHAERPSFRPDVRGSYSIANRVTERTRAGELVGRSARDLVEVAATPSYVPPIGEPIETLALGSEGKLGVKLGGSFFALEGVQAAVQVLMIDPTTLATWTRTFEAPAEALDAIESGDTNPGTIVVVQGRELPQEEGWQGAISSQIGASSKWSAPASGSPSFSAIGVKGIPAGQGWGNAEAGALGNGTTGALRGYIAPNYELMTNPEEATYTFTPSTYFSYDTNTTGVGGGATSVTAQVGPTKVSGSLSSGQVGLLVAELDAGSLALRSSQSFAVAAAGSQEVTAQGEVEALASWLEGHQGGDALVLVQSIGTLPTEPPRPPQSKSSEEERRKLVEAWARAAVAIGNLGGRRGLFLTGGGGGYSLIGSTALAGAGVPAAENATTMLQYTQPEVVRLAGTIELGHLGTLVPATNTSISTPGATVESNPDAIGNFELPLIAYQQRTPWPYEPGSRDEDAAVVAAGHYISEKICGAQCDDEVRHLYVVPNFDLKLLIREADFKCPTEGASWEGTGFSKDDCETALTEFRQESQQVNHIDEYFSTSNNGLLYPLNAVVGEQQAGLETIGNNVEAAVNPPQEQVSHVEWLLFAQTFAIIGGALVSPELAPATTLMDTGLNLAEAFTVTPAGESAFQVETTVDHTVAHVAAMVSAQQEAMGNLKALIVSDYGKLSEMTSNTTGKDPLWNLPSDWSAIKEQLSFGLRATFYRTFLPTVSETNTGLEWYGYKDVALTQNVCITHESFVNPEEWPFPEAPSCSGASSPEWTTVAPGELTAGLVCWDYYWGDFHTEKMGEHWAEAEYVVPEANAIWEWEVNPYYPLAGAG
ncbi:MAG: hypothetical protein AB7P38_10795, partial [Solirubrobacterales bacterium]